MLVTERTLRNWRVEALLMGKSARLFTNTEHIPIPTNEVITLCERILRMSSELLDQHLLRKVK